MKNGLPEQHGIHADLLNSSLIYRDTSGTISLTDAQYAGIDNGITSGSSGLIIAPTSSGKTEIGLLAAASWLRNGDGLTERVVYLVSHRALARQKFKEIQSQNMLSTLGVQPAEMVLSTGDATLDANGAIPEDPLSARFLIATYEKFLGLLASSGYRQDMTNFCIIADEFQIIADLHRGQSIEILFTMIKMAGYGQFIGLSAALSDKDAENLAGWLEVPSILVQKREVPLAFELRSTTNTFSWTTDGSDIPDSLGVIKPLNTIEILSELESDPENNFPVAIFCMTKRRIRDLAKAWGRHVGGAEGDGSILSLFDESTGISEVLATYIPRGFGIHTADLIDTERDVVEDKLDHDTLPVVFATTTLAQGLNYSFKTVVFDHWCRHNFERRMEEPITISEFHNISGRAGRLSLQDHGKVIYVSKEPKYDKSAAQYLTGNVSDQVAGRIDPNLIENVVLQLLSSGMAEDKDGFLNFLNNSLSGYLEREVDTNSEAVWEDRLDAAISSLSSRGFVV